MRTPQLCCRRAGVIAPEYQFTTRTRRHSARFVGRAAEEAARVLWNALLWKDLDYHNPARFVVGACQARSKIPCWKIFCRFFIL